MDAVPATAQGADHGKRRGRGLHAQPYGTVDVPDRDGDTELGEGHRHERQVIALPGERRQLGLVRPLEELKRPLAEVRLGGGDPAAGKLLQHPVRVEHDMPDVRPGCHDRSLPMPALYVPLTLYLSLSRTR